MTAQYKVHVQQPSEPDSAHPVLGRDVRSTLASPTDTADIPDPSAFQGVILHSPRVRGLSLKNRHTVLRTEPRALFAQAGIQLCPEV